jgi:pilus assembly protein CpaB
VSRFWIPVSGRVGGGSRPQPQANGVAPSGGNYGSAAPSGPSVRVTRGDKVTEVPVGGK